MRPIGYKNIMIAEQMKLHIKNRQLVIISDHEVSIPMEDINSIMIENRYVTVSAHFLQMAAELGVAVFVCNDKHIPNGVLLPMAKHSRHYKMLKNQLSINKPFQKRLWQQIIIQKINNQARCLEILEVNGYEKLYQFANVVQSGDKTNIEAKSAAFYFRALYGDGFTRDQDNIINAMLNYGYSIVRGLIARSLICYGFETSIGLFHHSELNSYNLADDMIEPFRSVVDLYVSTICLRDNMPEEMSPTIKKELYKIITLDMMSGDEKHSVSNAIDRLIMSYSSCLSGGMEGLILPSLLKQQYHRYE